MINHFRDVTLLPISGNYLVIACDSSAAIGLKKYDQVSVSPAITAACCLRVPLLELFCLGAQPICIIDLIGNEYEDTGKQMLAGIRSGMRIAAIEVPLNGSTEENMMTVMSSIGITVIGELPMKVQLPAAEVGNRLFQVGIPLVGEDVSVNLDQLPSYELIKNLQKESGVTDLLPVGSKGIGFEASLMAKRSSLEPIFYQPNSPELLKSAGPATVVLAAVKEDLAAELAKKYPMMKEIGRFTS